MKIFNFFYYYLIPLKGRYKELIAYPKTHLTIKLFNSNMNIKLRI